VTLTTLVRVAGMSWAVEEGFQAVKSQTGSTTIGAALDRLAPTRHVGHAPARLPHGLRHQASPPPPADPRHQARHGRPIALTAAEIRRLFAALITTPIRARITTPTRVISHALYHEAIQAIL